MVSARYMMMPLAVILILFTSCGKNETSVPDNVNFREEMRNFVMEISTYARNIDPDFLVIPQNGQELITDNGESDGILQTGYLHAFDATGREELFYGYDNGDDKPTPEEDKQHWLALCLLCEQNDIEVLTTDYCFTHSKMDDSYQLNEENGFISFAADHRGLNDIPDYPVSTYNENSNDVTSIDKARNFLYLIDDENFATKEDFIDAVSATNYDAVIIDLFHDGDPYVKSEIDQLRTKQNGGKRLVICYLSIGEAENYRYYWHSAWKAGNPYWLGKENPDWEGNFLVWYWAPEWQNIISGNDDSYVKKVLDAGFDGIYLDMIDAFENFE
jgi:cysteinyl-tRNA synthetase, unknown class